MIIFWLYMFLLQYDWVLSKTPTSEIKWIQMWCLPQISGETISQYMSDASVEHLHHVEIRPNKLYHGYVMATRSSTWCAARRKANKAHINTEITTRAFVCVHLQSSLRLGLPLSPCFIQNRCGRAASTPTCAAAFQSICASHTLLLLLHLCSSTAWTRCPPSPHCALWKPLVAKPCTDRGGLCGHMPGADGGGGEEGRGEGIGGGQGPYQPRTLHCCRSTTQRDFNPSATKGSPPRISRRSEGRARSRRAGPEEDPSGRRHTAEHTAREIKAPRIRATRTDAITWSG